MRFKINLRELREKNKMTQEDLAEKVGVTRQYIGMLEASSKNVSPSVETAKKIATALGFDWVLFFEDEKENVG